MTTVPGPERDENGESPTLFARSGSFLLLSVRSCEVPAEGRVSRDRGGSGAEF
jgi:hypothetical protein